MIESLTNKNGEKLGLELIKKKDTRKTTLVFSLNGQKEERFLSPAMTALLLENHSAFALNPNRIHIILKGEKTIVQVDNEDAIFGLTEISFKRTSFAEEVQRLNP